MSIALASYLFLGCCFLRGDLAMTLLFAQVSNQRSAFQLVGSWLAADSPTIALVSIKRRSTMPCATSYAPQKLARRARQTLPPALSFAARHTFRQALCAVVSIAQFHSSSPVQSWDPEGQIDEGFVILRQCMPPSEVFGAFVRGLIDAFEAVNSSGRFSDALQLAGRSIRI